MKLPLIILTTLFAPLLSGCASSGPDFTPIGEGLKAIAIALVAFGVVGALTRLIQVDEKPRDSDQTDRRQSEPSDHWKGGE